MTNDTTNQTLEDTTRPEVIPLEERRVVLSNYEISELESLRWRVGNVDRVPIDAVILAYARGDRLGA